MREVSRERQHCDRGRAVVGQSPRIPSDGRRQMLDTDERLSPARTLGTPSRSRARAFGPVVFDESLKRGLCQYDAATVPVASRQKRVREDRNVERRSRSGGT